MQKSVRHLSLDKMTAFYIWTLRKHDFIISRLTTAIWLGSLSVLMLGLTNVIAMKLAMGILLWAGVVICLSLWVMIERRKSFFLKLKDSELRRQVHVEMLLFIRQRQKKKGFWVEKLFRFKKHS